MSDYILHLDIVRLHLDSHYSDCHSDQGKKTSARTLDLDQESTRVTTEVDNVILRVLAEVDTCLFCSHVCGMTPFANVGTYYT